MMERDRCLDLEISNLIYSYVKKEKVEEKLNEFIKKNYYIALEKMKDYEKIENKDIIYYTKIIDTVSIFNSLLSYRDDYEVIYDFLRKDKYFLKFILILFEEKNITNINLCEKFNKSSKEMIEIINKFPDCGIFTIIRCQNEDFNQYNLTEKGIDFIKNKYLY